MKRLACIGAAGVTVLMTGATAMATVAATTGVIVLQGFVVTGATGAGPLQAQYQVVTSGTGTVYQGSALRMKRVI
jgi:hypothetical protein